MTIRKVSVQDKEVAKGVSGALVPFSGRILSMDDDIMMLNKFY